MTLSGQTYRCRAGETFDLVALRMYGNEKYACELLCANPLLSTVPVFQGGETLKLPAIEVPENEYGEEYMPAAAPWKER